MPSTQQAKAGRDASSRKGRPFVDPETVDFLQVVGTWLLNRFCLAFIFFATGGIMYAMVVSTCMSTKTCEIGRFLELIGAKCRNMEEDRLLHGQTCKLECGGRSRPSVDELRCADGAIVGIENVKCIEPPVEAWTMFVPDLGEDVTIEDAANTICRKEARCDPYKDSHVYVSVGGLTQKLCFSLLKECRRESSEYSFAEHVGGMCNIGCLNKDRIVEQAPDYNENAIIAASILRDKQKESLEGACFLAGPRCINIKGSCNPADDGDYYRQEMCKNEFAVYEQLNGSRQMHRVSTLRGCGQGGYWILQRPDDPYGELDCRVLGRQDSFQEAPELGTDRWSIECRREVAENTMRDITESVELTLSNCDCSDADCSFRGTATGTKQTDEGRAGCACKCDDEYFGDSCEFRKCRAPLIPDTLNTACAEGPLIKQNEVCTVLCKPGFVPSTKTMECQADGLYAPRALYVRCERDMTKDLAPGSANLSLSEDLNADVAVLNCAQAKCGPGGSPSGDRDDAGNCICECMAGWAGPTCSESTEFCRAPIGIEFAKEPPCVEGRQIKDGACTTLCEQGYAPTAKRLDCFRKVLTPATFECIKVDFVSETLCVGLQILAITMMSVAGLFVLGRLVGNVSWTVGRPVQAFLCRDQKVGTVKDDFGGMHVVKMNQGYLRKLRYPIPRGAQLAADRMRADANAAPQPPTVEPPRLDLHTPGDDWDSSDEEESEDLENPPEGDDSQEHPRLSLTAPGNDVKDAASETLRSLASSPEKRLSFANSQDGADIEQRISFAFASSPERRLSLASSPEKLALQKSKERLSRKKSKEIAIFEPVLSEAEQQQQLALYQAQTEARGAVVRAEALLARRKAGAVVFAEQLTHLANDVRELQLKGANAADHILDELVETSAQIEKEEEEESKKRSVVEDALVAAMQDSDRDQLQVAADVAREYLEQSAKCPAGKRVRLQRYLQLADDRLRRALLRDNVTQRQEAREVHVKKGMRPNYKMTSQDMWKAVEASDLGSVVGGLKARLSPLGRCKSTELSLLHVACQHADSQDGVQIVRALLEARADGNVRDPHGRTPLDLAAASEGSSMFLTELAALGLVRGNALPELRSLARPHTAPCLD